MPDAGIPASGIPLSRFLRRKALSQTPFQPHRCPQVPNLRVRPSTRTDLPSRFADDRRNHRTRRPTTVMGTVAVIREPMLAVEQSSKRTIWGTRATFRRGRCTPITARICESHPTGNQRTTLDLSGLRPVHRSRTSRPIHHGPHTASSRAHCSRNLLPQDTRSRPKRPPAHDRLHHSVPTICIPYRSPSVVYEGHMSQESPRGGPTSAYGTRACGRGRGTRRIPARPPDVPDAYTGRSYPTETAVSARAAMRRP